MSHLQIDNREGIVCKYDLLGNFRTCVFLSRLFVNSTPTSLFAVDSWLVLYHSINMYWKVIANIYLALIKC